MPGEPYTTVIGLEVHVQLLTRTKLFCGCLNQFGLPPNSATCPVCLGLPGVLPVMNRKAFDLAVRAALALNCNIAGFTKWDRKNYYYPDLPKNFQTSQYDLPFSYAGHLDINVHADPKKGYTPKTVRITRAHLEEDAGKSMHDDTGRGGASQVDLNRTGTPLLEIVSEPDLRSPEEAITYLDELRLMLKELGVSDCEMQEGSLRCDANVNIHVPQSDGSVVATPLVEIKNLNSFRAVGRAITYEAKRHYDEYTKNPAGFRIDKLLKTTAGWVDPRGVTVVQRHKESLADYRFFPEPDLVPVVVTADEIAAARAAMGELPGAARARLQSQYGLSVYDADVLVAKGRAVVGYFEELAAALKDGKAAANRLSDLVYPALAERREEIGEFPVRPAALTAFLTATASAQKQTRLDLFKYMLDKSATLEAAATALGISFAVDETKLRAAVAAAIAGNPKAVADYRAGKEQSKMAILGAVMKANKGAPNDVVRRLLDEELGKS